MDRHWCDDRFLIHVNKSCHPNPHRFCRVRSRVSRCLWRNGKNSRNNTRFSGHGRKLACGGQRSITLEWMIQMLMLSQCVSLWINKCWSNLRLNWTVLNPTMRFSWIQAEWERHYIRDAKDMILTLVWLQLSTQPFFFLMTCRCAGIVTKNWQRQKL